MHIVGTAGHVDHGKSSLVAALTGTNPDRWIEERLRGMTLDLGFAHLRFADGLEAGIVDVPGHERFLHNMLAGAAGMELLLLVVAATEGVMPQTTEHLDILRYLNVHDCLVVVTKIDLLAEAERESAIARIRAALAGTLSANAQLLAVSSQSGEGMQALREAIHESLRRLPARPIEAPAFLPIDRVFALPGRGTILTGTLMQGTLKVGDRLQLLPQRRDVRVRGLHVFGETRSEVSAGSRVAVNIPGVETTDVARGDVLCHAQFRANDAFDVAFTPLQNAVGILRRRNPVRVYVGSAEMLGTLVLGETPAGVQQRPAQLHLRRAVAGYPGAHFVVRRMSPKTLLGGGTIRNEGAAIASSGEVATEDSALLAVLRASAQPLTLLELAARANVREDVAQEALTRLATEKRAFLLSKPAAYVDSATADVLLKTVSEKLAAFEQREPWTMGMTSLALARALAMAEPLVVRYLAAFVEEGAIAAGGGYFSSVGHTPHLTAEQRAFFERAVPLDAREPFVPASLPAVVAAMAQAKIGGIAQAFDTLVARGALVKVGDAVYRGTQIAVIHERVEAFLRREKQMTMAQFRDLLSTSRKFAVPLLEWFDARGITVRSGDFRMLRSKKVT